MCNILYYRFAVLAQFFKLIFSFFYNLKIRCDFFLLSLVAVLLFSLYTYLFSYNRVILEGKKKLLPARVLYFDLFPPHSTVVSL